MWDKHRNILIPNFATDHKTLYGYYIYTYLTDPDSREQADGLEGAIHLKLIPLLIIIYKSNYLPILMKKNMDKYPSRSKLGSNVSSVNR